MSHSCDGPSVVATLRTKLVPFTAVCYLPPSVSPLKTPPKTNRTNSAGSGKNATAENARDVGALWQGLPQLLVRYRVGNTLTKS